MIVGTIILEQYCATRLPPDAVRYWIAGLTSFPFSISRLIMKMKLSEPKIRGRRRTTVAVDVGTDLRPNHSAVTPVSKMPTVNLVILDPEGVVLGELGCDSSLAGVLSRTSSLNSSSGFPISKQDVGLFPLGQDRYSVDRAYVLSVSGLIVQSCWADILALPAKFRESYRYVFVVSV